MGFWFGGFSGGGPTRGRLVMVMGSGGGPTLFPELSEERKKKMEFTDKTPVLSDLPIRFKDMLPCFRTSLEGWSYAP